MARASLLILVAARGRRRARRGTVVARTLAAGIALVTGLSACLSGTDDRDARAVCHAVHEHIVDLTLGDAPARADQGGARLAAELAAHRRNLLAASAEDIAACEASARPAFTACALRATNVDELLRCDGVASGDGEGSR
jgi:hypothetical protein